jgi:hypothetical protein
LFSGYKAARDTDFNRTISDIEKDYMHGKSPDLTDTELMAQAQVAYQVRVESKTWGALSPEQEVIVAMQAKIDGIKDSNLKLDTSKKPRFKGGGNKPVRQDKRTKDKVKNKSDLWKFSNSSDAKTMLKGEVKYYWCTHHRQGEGMWVTHKLADCRNRRRDEGADNDEDAEANAAIAAINDSDEEEEESETDE